ncbi:hypothetical protein, partial [Craterilacuibacter sp.]|uniref:hypothetical protein n=1 Tax=Craterilacuibacter sp. TaxID=2870909 RepID=UPI003F314716
TTLLPGLEMGVCGSAVLDAGVHVILGQGKIRGCLLLSWDYRWGGWTLTIHRTTADATLNGKSKDG